MTASKDIIQLAIEASVKAEREACAKLCEALAKWHSETVAAAFESAAEEIRMRGDKND
jgi:hypothetical protein